MALRVLEITYKVGSDGALVKQGTRTEVGGLSSSLYKVSLSRLWNIVQIRDVLKDSTEDQMTPSLLDQRSASDFLVEYHTSFLLFENHTKLDW